MKKVLTIALAFLMALSVIGCATTPTANEPVTETPDQTTTEAPAESAEGKRVVKIGLLAPISGAVASQGQMMEAGLRTCIEYFEENVGFKNHPEVEIQVVVADTESSVDAGVSAFERLVNVENVDIVAAFGDLSTMAKYAMQARRAMYEYGTGPDVWKEIAIAQRNWACLNPAAGMYGKPLDDEAYYSADMVAEPLRLLDATPNSDGGRAVILTTVENARTLNIPYAVIRGFGSSNHPESPLRISVYDEESAAAVASKRAFDMAGITCKDVDACELYDCFTYTVEATLRDYGFFRREEVRDFITRSRLGPGGELPVNTSGGMLSEAYFMGLTPLSEAVSQLTGKCGERQLGKVADTKEPCIMVCSDNGAVFQSHVTLVLERGK